MLSEAPLPLPRIVAEPPGSPSPADGFLTPGFERGALILRGPRGVVVRLSWEAEAADGAESSDERRALPAGSYDLVGYRILERGEDGSLWHVSASAPKGKPIRVLEVEAGATSSVDVDGTVHVKRRLGASQIGMGIQGEGEAGLSIYKDGKRIPIRFELRDHAGGVVAEGRMRYG